jgi:hypothetical protein
MLGSLVRGQYLQHLRTNYPHLVSANYHMFTSVAALPQAAPQPSSVVYPPRQVQLVSEIMDQLIQLKCVVSDLKLDLVI